MKGRYINQLDIKEKKKSAVIGRLVAKDLFKGEEAVGKYINVGSTAFKVIGVFQDDGVIMKREIYIYLILPDNLLKKAMIRLIKLY